MRSEGGSAGCGLVQSSGLVGVCVVPSSRTATSQVQSHLMCVSLTYAMWAAGANLSGCDLSKANLTDATLEVISASSIKEYQSQLSASLLFDCFICLMMLVTVAVSIPPNQCQCRNCSGGAGCSPG